MRASITDIPFASGTFDLVTSFDVLSTLDDAMEQRALAEIRRMLRPGGALIVNTAALRFLRGQHAVFASEVRPPVARPAARAPRWSERASAFPV